MSMKHKYAREKLTLLLRDLDHYNGDEFWRQMSRIANGATQHPSAEVLQETVTLSVTCLTEIYNALGLGGINETKRHCLALKTIEDLNAKEKESEQLAAHVERLTSTGTAYINIEDIDDEEDAATIAANFNDALMATPATSAKDRDSLQRTKALTNAADWFRALFKGDETLTAETVQDILNDLASQHASEFFNAPAKDANQ